MQLAGALIMAILKSKSDVGGDVEVYLRQSIYPEPALPGIPQQLLVVGVHQASEIPDFAYEWGLVSDTPPEPKQAGEAVPAPDSESTPTRRTAKKKLESEAEPAED